MTCHITECKKFDFICIIWSMCVHICIYIIMIICTYVYNMESITFASTQAWCIENLRERWEANERSSKTDELIASRTLANAHMLQESEGEIFGNSCTLVLTRAFSGVHGFGRASSSSPWSKFERLCHALLSISISLRLSRPILRGDGIWWIPTGRVLATKHCFRIFAHSLDPCTRISRLLEAWRRTPGQKQPASWKNKNSIRQVTLRKLHKSKSISCSTRISKHQHHFEIWQTSAQNCIILPRDVAEHLGLNWTWVGFPTKSTQQTPSLLDSENYVQRDRSLQRKVLKLLNIQRKRNKLRHVFGKKKKTATCWRSSRRERAWERTTEGRLPVATSATVSVWPFAVDLPCPNWPRSYWNLQVRAFESPWIPHSNSFTNSNSGLQYLSVFQDDSTHTPWWLPATSWNNQGLGHFTPSLGTWLPCWGVDYHMWNEGRRVGLWQARRGGITLRNRARNKIGETRRQIRNGKRMEQLENKVEQVAHVGTHMTSRLWMPAVRHHRTTQPCCLDALSVGRDRLRRCYTLQHHDEGAEMPRKSSRKMLKSITGGASLNTTLLSLPGIKHVRLMGGCSKIVRPKQNPMKSLSTRPALCSNTKRCENGELFLESPGSGIPKASTFSTGTWLAWTQFISRVDWIDQSTGGHLR